MTGLNTGFWQGKRVLVTGHSGFKGSWLTLWLHQLGANIAGISLAPSTTPSLFELARVDALCQSHFIDIRDSEPLRQAVTDFAPQVVFHLAAQALVRPGYQRPLDTFASNVMGTANLLDALRGNEALQAVVCVTTDKVYHNNEWAWPYRETDPLGGIDPYSASKAASELVISSYRDAFFAGGPAIASARAGNVIGGGDWSQDRLLPDAIRAWSQGDCLEVRRPEAVRPWQHVLDCLHAYLQLAERLCRIPSLAGAYNFGPAIQDSATVRQVIDLAQPLFGQGRTHYHPVAGGPHEAGQLTLDVSLARQQLGIRGCWSLHQAVAKTMHWYKAQLQQQDARALCLDDIRAFEAACHEL